MTGPTDCQCDTNALRTPELVVNRSGRSELDYRVGTHASFLDTMTARLSNFSIEVPKKAPDGQLNLPPEIRDDRQFLGFLLHPFDRVAIHLRKLLQKTTADLLHEYQAGHSEQELVERVSAELGKLLPRHRLSTHQQFSPALITPEIHQLLCRGRLDPDARLLLNKLILHRCLPSVFPHPYVKNVYPLSRLTTRAPSDPSIALLDAWSTVGDVLTFYQERIANESYLRTATERKSLFELSRLVGYRPRPGVAASGFVAFTLEENLANPDEALKLTIPAGTQCRSTPGDGEDQQVFETSETIEARSEWNEIRPRLSRPQEIIPENARDLQHIYLEGALTTIKENDFLLFVFGESRLETRLAKIEEIVIDQTEQKTFIRFTEDTLSPVVFARLIIAQITGLIDAIQVGGFAGLVAYLELIVEAAKPKPDPLDPARERNPSLVDLDGVVESNISGPIEDFPDMKQRLSNLLPDARNDGVLLTSRDRFQMVIDALVGVRTTSSGVSSLEWTDDTGPHRLLAELDVFITQVSSGGIDLAEIQRKIALIFEKDDPDTIVFKADVAFILRRAAFAILSSRPDDMVSGIGAKSKVRARLVEGEKGILKYFIQLLRRASPVGSTFYDVANAFANTSISLFDAADQFQEIHDSDDFTDAQRAKTIDQLIGDVTTGTTAYVSAVNAVDETLDVDPFKAAVAAIGIPVEGFAGAIELILIKTVLTRLHVHPNDDIRGLSGLVTEVNNIRQDLSDKVIPFRSIQNPLQFLVGILNELISDLRTFLQLGAAGSLTLQQQVEILDREIPRFSPIHVIFLSLDRVSHTLHTSKEDKRETFITRVATIADRYADPKVYPNPSSQNVIDATELLKVVSKWVYPAPLPGTITVPKLLDKLAKELATVVESLTTIRENATDQNELEVADFMIRVIDELDLLIRRVTAPGGVTPTPTQPSVETQTQLSNAVDLLRSLAEGDASRRQLANIVQLLGLESETLAQLIQELQPVGRDRLFTIWRRLRNPDYKVRVFLVQKRASLFGQRAPQLVDLEDPTGNPIPPKLGDDWGNDIVAVSERSDELNLESEFDEPVPGGFIGILEPGKTEPQVFKIAAAEHRSRAAYGLTGKSTNVDLDGDPWWSPVTDGMPFIRGTTVFLQGDELHLAEEPISTALGPISTPVGTRPDDRTELGPAEVLLNGLYDGLRPGTKLVIRAEALDNETDSIGFDQFESVEVANTTHVSSGRPTDRTHTQLTLTRPLLQPYRRRTLRIFGNVAPTTHGESQRNEILGSGDSSQAFQRFSLAQIPLTHLSAANANGTETTLEVRVNNVLWNEADSFLSASRNDRSFVTSMDESGSTTIITGDGQRGARVPTGIENVTATYRKGIGEAGNVRAGQIDQPPSEPAGIREVINPQATTGGTDAEDSEQIRANTPLGVIALDRIVSVHDYADFARNFAGIGKAASTVLSSGRGRIVFVTVTGTGATSLTRRSEAVENLRLALRRQGDPDQPVLLDVAERTLLVMSARIRVLSDHLYADVEQRIKSTLVNGFSYRRRNLGQDAHATEVVSLIQSVAGVAYVDLDGFDGVAETVTPAQLAAFHLRFADGRPKPRIPVNDAGLREHTVVEGETLIRIADRFGDRTSLDRIYELNRILDGIAPDNDQLWKLLVAAGQTRIVVSLTWPAQIAYFSPTIENTIVLNEITT